MLSEKQLVDYLDKILVDQIQFQTYFELQITNKHLDLAEIVDQDLIRIDLAGINQIDGSIHFFEAETQLHVQHPAIYRKFCDYCHLVCPDSQLDQLDTQTKYKGPIIDLEPYFQKHSQCQNFLQSHIYRIFVPLLLLYLYQLRLSLK